MNWQGEKGKADGYPDNVVSLRALPFGHRTSPPEGGGAYFKGHGRRPVAVFQLLCCLLNSAVPALSKGSGACTHTNTRQRFSASRMRLPRWANLQIKHGRAGLVVNVPAEIGRGVASTSARKKTKRSASHTANGRTTGVDLLPHRRPAFWNERDCDFH